MPVIGKLETVALVADFFVFVVFLAVNVAAIVLRYKKPDLPRPYRIPLTIGRVPLPALLGILLTLLLMAYTIYGLMLPGGSGAPGE